MILIIQRFRSLTEIENFKDNPRDIKIPLFDKKSSDFCFERSREILSKPFSIDLNTATLDKRYFDKKTRDLIGENLLDIEKTLNALNLDFLQAFNELEKTDSAETLFGENFLLENNLKTQNSLKAIANFKKLTNDLDNTAKKSAKDFYSPIEKKSNASDKSFSPKDSQRTTPNSYSPQECGATSRGGFIFNYPANNRNMFLSPTKRMFANQQFLNHSRKFEDNSQTGPRKRSMSFTDNFEVKSPISANAAVVIRPNLGQKTLEGRKTGSLDEEGDYRSFKIPSNTQLLANKPRSVITYKPKSIRARNLRRLSYNPLNMINSSSSSSDSEMEHSIAHSECDIRSRAYSSRFQKRRQQYLTTHRKLNNSSSSGYYKQSKNGNNSSNPNVNGRDKLYGSNASIKSAPHYNYMSDRKKLPVNEQATAAEDKTTMSSSDLDSEEDLNNTISAQRKSQLTPTPRPPTQQPQISSNLNNIYEFVGKCFNRNFNSSTGAHQQSIKEPQKFLKNKNYFNYGNGKGTKISSSNLDLLYSEFDVSKLTGKSPTTQSYFDIMDYSNSNKKQMLRKNDNKTPNNGGSGTFHWPEKIHGSTVKQNDLIWQLQKQHEQDMQEKEQRRMQQKRLLMENFQLKKSAYSSDSSSTENELMNFGQEFMPPSPAP